MKSVSVIEKGPNWDPDIRQSETGNSSISTSNKVTGSVNITPHTAVRQPVS